MIHLYCCNPLLLWLKVLYIYTKLHFLILQTARIFSCFFKLNQSCLFCYTKCKFYLLIILAVSNRLVANYHQCRLFQNLGSACFNWISSLYRFPAYHESPLTNSFLFRISDLLSSILWSSQSYILTSPLPSDYLPFILIPI